MKELALLNETGMYTSMDLSDDASKVVMYNAMNNPTSRLSEHVNEEILVKDVFIEQVTLTNSETGEVSNPYRIVLIDMDGNSYVAVSTGVYNSVRKLIMIFGSPTWENGLRVKVRQITKGRNKITTLDAI